MANNVKIIVGDVTYSIEEVKNVIMNNVPDTKDEWYGPENKMTADTFLIVLTLLGWNPYDYIIGE